MNSKSSQLIDQAIAAAEARGIDLCAKKLPWMKHVSFDGENPFEIFEDGVALGKKAQIGQSLFFSENSDEDVFFLLGTEADLVTKLNAL